jgi:hypothetical protein
MRHARLQLQAAPKQHTHTVRGQYSCRFYCHVLCALIIIVITATTATTIVAATNAATRPIVFKQTRPLRAPSRLSATASLHCPNIGSIGNTELCVRKRKCLVIGFTRAEQRRPQFGELALEPF